MSIASEMTNLAANRDAIKAAIEAKNPSVAPTDALSSFPASIASISGGGSSASPVAAMYGWPDIKALLAADTEDFAHKAYVLFDASAYPTVPYICQMHDLQVIGDCAKAITSDGATYTSASTHTWDTTKLIDGRYGWIAFYSNNKFSRMFLTQSYSPSSASMPRVLWVVGNTGVASPPNTYGYGIGAQYGYSVRAIEFPDAFVPKINQTRIFFSCESLSVFPGLDCSASTTVNNYLAGCKSLVELSSVGDLSSCTNAQGFLANCNSLMKVPSVMDLLNCTVVSSLFQNCVCLTAVPDVINLSSVTSANNQLYMFQGCRSIRSLPTHVTSNWNLSLSDLTAVTDKDSVATFTNGSITGGFVGNLNTCPNNGQTITLNSAIKGLFTASEQSAIEAAMTAKNWTLSW